MGKVPGIEAWFYCFCGDTWEKSPMESARFLKRTKLKACILELRFPLKISYIYNDINKLLDFFGFSNGLLLGTT